MNRPTTKGAGSNTGADLPTDPPAKCLVGNSDSVQKEPPAQTLPSSPPRKAGAQMRGAMTTLLQLCVAGIWLYGACRLFGQAHPVLASTLLLVGPCQVCVQLIELIAGKKHRAALPQGDTRFPRRQAESAPWHSLRQTLLENDFNEKVSVMMPSIGHVGRHAERAGKGGTSPER